MILRHVLWASIFSAGACSGAIGHAPSDSADPPPVEMAAPTPPSAGGESVGATPLRRLSRLEYNNTVHDLLGDTSRAGDTLPEDSLGPSRFTTGGVVSVAEARAFSAAARALATTAVTNLPTLSPCDPAKLGDDACARSFVQAFGRRAFRRPLGAEEEADLLALYTWARKEQAYPFREAIRVVLQAMLQAPSFVYHADAATAGAVPRLTPHTVASRLSYFLWSSMPDETLLAAADANRLGTPADIEAQARRLLADARAGDTLRAFHADWLKLYELGTVEKDTARYPDFTPAMRAAMLAETPAFVADLFAQPQAPFEALLLSNHTFADSTSGKLYGLQIPKGPLQRVVPEAAQQRAGILTHLGILAAAATPYSSSPIKRGQFVREQLLCMDLPPPPPGVDTTPPTPDPRIPARQQFQQHSDDPACRNCHLLIDPIGFAFEHYDGIGRFRATDGGKPVDASGSLVATPKSDGTFTGARGLAERLARSEDAQACLVRQWFRFATGRMETADGPSIQAALQAFAGAKHDMRELLVAIAKTPAFVTRAAVPGEVLK